jgi:ribosomal protein L37AE/L43A
MSPHLPPATELSRAQFDGWACVYCGHALRKGAVSVGRATGRAGAHDLSIEVYACPGCAATQGRSARKER